MRCVPFPGLWTLILSSFANGVILSDDTDSDNISGGLIACLAIVSLQMKCCKYWPDDTELYGDIKITLLKTETLSDYTVRTFSMERVSRPPPSL